MSDPSPEHWERLFKASRYRTIEQLRDAIDLPGWRDRDRARELAKKVGANPPRAVDPRLGEVGARHYRQCNVKLSTPDFEALTALAIARDLAPTTLARMLLRNAIRDAADNGG